MHMTAAPIPTSSASTMDIWRGGTFTAADKQEAMRWAITGHAPHNQSHVGGCNKQRPTFRVSNRVMPMVPSKSTMSHRNHTAAATS